MARRLPEVDVVLVGMGWTGALLAKELTDAGLRVVGLERGVPRQTVPDFQTPTMHDELRYAVRHGLMLDPATETLTFRNFTGQTALPIRQLGSFLPGAGLGGAGVHWNGQTWRFHASDFNLRTHTEQRYGRDIIQEGLTIQDWGLSYDELEPYYDRFEKICGIGGKAGNLRGVIQPGGDPFEAPRSSEYPLPPMPMPLGPTLFAQAAEQVGAHPFPLPSANLSRPYTNSYGCHLQPCNACGFCERFGCEHFAKSSPQVCVLPVLMGRENFELRTRSTVTRVNYDSTAKRATGVTYIDAMGQEVEQPAGIVALCAFSYHNVRLLLLSGIGQPYDPASGEGVVGKNYTYQTMAGVSVFLDGQKNINPYMGAGALGMAVNDWQGDVFDHSGLGFIGGAYLGGLQTGGRPIEYHPVPSDTPRWGGAWKQAVRQHYNSTLGISVHGSSMPHRYNYLDLDPTYRDGLGQPLLRMTFDFPANDRLMADYLTDRALEIGRAMGGRVEASRRTGHYSIVPYQTTHNTGGAIMGANPRESVVNRYLQHWDAHNLFVMGACVYPHNPGFNPTGTVGALALWAARAIREDYLADPRPLVQA
ncbi:GMC family oxidoreductase [Falsiroseomonas selenitidurans]|uniref:GMC family oxidoreductase n=1 Tax=Falsiroseomonas selenitidurans TaxID=2716335 RepID=A0ABX1DX31_9PROT|nr:GMC family oxidoreductase [Falsiroseomonas selenitidurans]NKC29474.1 GMC family oxidoreductase [Falsiroseomonas selenitidurans]